MDLVVDLQFGSHEVNYYSSQQTMEIKAKITFEESFPFKELDELLQIIEKADPLTRFHILPKALKVAHRMKFKFSNSLSDDYANWLVKVDNAIQKLNHFSNEMQNIVSIQ